jgi:hypothetical protein
VRVPSGREFRAQVSFADFCGHVSGTHPRQFLGDDVGYQNCLNACRMAVSAASDTS